MDEIKFTNTERVLKDMADAMIQFMRNRLSNNNTNASYALSNSLNYIIETERGAIEVSVSLEEYWKYVENGTSPHWPPTNKIEEWIKVKPVIPEVRPVTYHWYTNGRKRGEPKTIYNERTVNKVPTVKQLAYLISRKISINGTKPQPFFWSSVEDAVQEFEDRLQEAITEDVGEIVNLIITPLKFD